MSVYFAYRTPYNESNGKYLAQFDNDSVLEWFHEQWEPIDDEVDADDYTLGVLGVEPRGFSSLFTAIAEHDLRRPRSMEALGRQLKAHLAHTDEVIASEHCLQVLAGDEDFQMAYYFFDDHYLETSRDKAAYLLFEDVTLPTETASGAFQPAVDLKAIEPAGNGSGSLYFTWLIPADAKSLQNLPGSFRLNGVRLPNLAQFLCWGTPQMTWPLELVILRACLIADKANLGAALRRMGRMDMGHLDGLAGTVLMGNGMEIVEAFQRYENKWLARGSVDDPSASEYQLEPHSASVSQFVFETMDDQLHFTQWFLFDDLWASANQVLANAILRHGTRWDVLS